MQNSLLVPVYLYSSPVAVFISVIMLLLFIMPQN
nr:MAG TPA: hypothetical protein [Caudoviricetes sp.]